MPAAGELIDPVTYAAGWVLVAIALPVLVVAWYAGVTWWTRDRSVSHRPRWWQLVSARRQALRELDRIAAGVVGGRLTPRQGHQSVSAAVRSFVALVSPLDARVMNLEQLRTAAPAELVGLVESVYPPAFAPDGDFPRAEEQLAAALEDARKLIRGWPR